MKKGAGIYIFCFPGETLKISTGRHTEFGEEQE